MKRSNAIVTVLSSEPFEDLRDRLEKEMGDSGIIDCSVCTDDQYRFRVVETPTHLEESIVSAKTETSGVMVFAFPKNRPETWANFAASIPDRKTWTILSLNLVV